MNNNAPRYVIIDYNKDREVTIAEKILFQEAATEYLTTYAKAFEELAKYYIRKNGSIKS